jgi:hypothetical protein
MTTQSCAPGWNRLRNADDPADQPLDADFWRVLQMARSVDHDEARVREWYRSEKIRELGGKTAQELVQMGEADLVIGFLRSIRRGYRD